MSLVDRITQAIRETEAGEDRAAYQADLVRWRTVRAVLMEARDELQRPAGGKRETLTLNPKAAA